MNYAMGATSIRLVPYALPSAAAALLYSCLFSYLGSAADDLLVLLNGGASAGFGATWLILGSILAFASAYGIVCICRRLLWAAPSGGDASGAPTSAAVRKEYAAVQQYGDGGGTVGYGGGTAVGSGAFGGGGQKEGDRGAQVVDVVAGGGCARAVNTYVVTNPSFSRPRRISVGTGG